VAFRFKPAINFGIANGKSMAYICVRDYKFLLGKGKLPANQIENALDAKNRIDEVLVGFCGFPPMFHS